MAVALLESAFIAGELSASVAGRYDVARIHVGAFTVRNFYISYRGGAFSRAGTSFVGFSRQTGRAYPPRMIPFQFSINQGLALEFGNFYMRVISDGAFVTESPFAITGITNANPAIVSYQALSTGTAAVANNSGVTGSYARGDFITLAGGAFSTPAQLVVNSSALAKLTLLAAGTGYAVNDTLTLSGGTSTLAPVLTVLTITGGGAIATFAISNGGSFTANGSGNFTQASTSGSGTGATFNGGLFGPLMLTFNNVGAYTAVPANPVNQASTTGTGVGATFTMTWAIPNALNSGDWAEIASVLGMPQVNGQTYVINNVTPASFSLSDVYGNTINSTAFGVYTGSGTASRIFTLTTPYSEVDLEYIKFVQSADDMTICCVNQQTLTEYAPLDLTRTTDISWTFSAIIPPPSILPPASCTGAASTSGSVDYNYAVTAVSTVDGTESIASEIADIPSAVDIASTAGSITITWATVPFATYNIYKATPAYAGTVPAGALLGFVGQAYGTQFVDSNITADDTQVPPLHKNPFARGQITGVNITNGGSGSSFTFTINSLTGSGAVLIPVVVSSVLVAFIVQDAGENYQTTDTITISGGATGTLTFGPESGTYPSVAAYFQERRALANTLNNPDTYFMSQPGLFTNFDSRVPTIDSDAIIGSPWAVEVNGIQWMEQTSGGLLVLTGLSAWLLVGSGSFATNVQPISPSTQDAVPQAFTGCSSTVPPIRINYDVIYVNSKGATYYDLPYQLYALSEPIDLTENSSQLFTGYTIREHAWCEQPNKVLWAVRNDGVLLSLTYYKTQQVAGWGRSDTNGLFQSVCSVTEPPVDALYVATQRFPGTDTAYMIERMDNRIWQTVEDCWCVDAGLALVQPTPNATLSASSATGLGSVTGASAIVGGQNYSAATTGSVVDENVGPNGPGPGTGAVPTLTFAGGVLTGVTFSAGNQGSGYLHPKLVLNDPEGSNGGSGASARLILNNAMTFTASAAVFSNGNVGSVIRMGGGVVSITGFTDSQHVIGNILSPIVDIIPNSGPSSSQPLVQMQPAGNWTMTAPVTTISGLNHLIGATVTGLADGNVIAPQVVSAQGTITLPVAASQVTVGLGFTAQLQSVFLDAGEPTVQGQRKKIAAVTARIESSGSFNIGTNQPDGSRLNPLQVAPVWNEGPGGLTLADTGQQNKAIRPYNSTTLPLISCDIRIPVGGGYDTRGQVAVEQDLPLPLQCLAFIPEIYGGDTPQTQAPKQQPRGR